MEKRKKNKYWKERGKVKEKSKIIRYIKRKNRRTSKCSKIKEG